MDIIRLELSIVIFTSLLSCIVSRAGPQKDADWTKRLTANHIKRKNDAKADGMELDRRDALQLANMVQTIIPGASATDYLSYGCYCGFGGKGEPVDEIDRCCQQHDRCYGGLTAQFGCSEWWRYFNRYDWKVDANKDVVCLPSSDKCKYGQCLCDKSMVKCFQKNRSVYNDQFTGFWWTFFKQC